MDDLDASCAMLSGAINLGVAFTIHEVPDGHRGWQIRAQQPGVTGETPVNDPYLDARPSVPGHVPFDTVDNCQAFRS